MVIGKRRVAHERTKCKQTLENMLYPYGVISNIRPAHRGEEATDVYWRCLWMNDGNIARFIAEHGCQFPLNTLTG